MRRPDRDTLIALTLATAWFAIWISVLAPILDHAPRH